MARLERLFDRYRRRHDPEDVAALFDRTAPGLLRIALHLAKGPAEAEDLVQQTFVTALERAASYDATRPIRPWLAGILRNHAREAARRRRRDATVPLSERCAAAPDVDAALDGISWDRRVAEAVEALPERYRQALVLRLRHGLAPAEIADVLDLPPATVRSHLHRGLAQLRERCTDRSIARPLAVLPAIRDLDGVREAVVTHARAVAVSTAATWTAGATTGVLGGAIVMPKLVPWVAGLGASLLLVGGLVASGVLDVGGSDPDTSQDGLLGAGAPSVESGPHLAGRGDVVPQEQNPAPGLGLPAPFDLDDVDRERDVHGVVVDREGRGIAGASLSLARLPWRNADLWTGALGRQEVEGPAGRTASDGTFSLRWEPGDWGRLRVEAQGYASVAYGEVQAGERLRIELLPPAALAVTVHDEEGAPVEGAHVSVSRWRWRAQPFVRRSGTTDADGRARLEDIRKAPRSA